MQKLNDLAGRLSVVVGLGVLLSLSSLIAAYVLILVVNYFGITMVAGLMAVTVVLLLFVDLITTKA